MSYWKSDVAKLSGRIEDAGESFQFKNLLLCSFCWLASYVVMLQNIYVDFFFNASYLPVKSCWLKQNGCLLSCCYETNNQTLLARDTL